MFKEINVDKVINDSLTENANCHVMVCEDSRKAFKTALNYGKMLRKQVIRETRDIDKGFWNISLKDGYEFIFCSVEYFKNENIQYSCLAFSK